MRARGSVLGLICLGVVVWLPAALGGCQAAGVARHDVTAAALEAMRVDGRPLTLVDVRTASEYGAVHIPGAVNRPVESIASWYGAFERDERICVYCEAGSRSLTAADYLVERGFTDVSNLLGGLQGWPGDVE